MTTVMLVQLYGQSRICYAMSRDGLFPKFFGHVHEKYRTPFKGTWFFGLLTAFAGGFININVLFELVNIGTLSAFHHRVGRYSMDAQDPAECAPRLPRAGRAGHPDSGHRILLRAHRRSQLGDLGAFRRLVRSGLIVYFGYSRKRSKLGLEQKAGADAKSLRLRTEVYRLTDSRWLLS